MWCALVLVFAMLALARQNKTRAPTTRGTFFSLLYHFWNQASLRHFYRCLNYSLLYRESVFNYKTETALRDHIEINILNNKKGNTCCDEKKKKKTCMLSQRIQIHKWKMKIYTKNLYRWDLNIFFSLKKILLIVSFINLLERMDNLIYIIVTWKRCKIIIINFTVLLSCIIPI